MDAHLLQHTPAGTLCPIGNSETGLHSLGSLLTKKFAGFNVITLTGLSCGYSTPALKVYPRLGFPRFFFFGAASTGIPVQVNAVRELLLLRLLLPALESLSLPLSLLS